VFTHLMRRSSRCSMLSRSTLTVRRSRSSSGYPCHDRRLEARWWGQKIFDIVARLKEQLLDPPLEMIAKVPACQTAPGPRVEVHYVLVVPEGVSQNMQWHFPKGRSENQKGDDHRSNTSLLLGDAFLNQSEFTLVKNVSSHVSMYCFDANIVWASSFLRY